MKSSLFGQVAVELERMNVVYAVLDNPIWAVVNDLPDSCLRLESSMGTVKKDPSIPSLFFWNGPMDSNLLILKVIDICHDSLITTKTLRVKRIHLAAWLGGNPKYNNRCHQIGLKEFKLQGGVAAIIVDLDIDGKCDMVSYTFQITSGKTHEVQRVINRGARFTPEAQALIQNAQAGDWVRIYNFATSCPGDREPVYLDQALQFLLK